MAMSRGPGHQRAPDHQHLLLAAGEDARLLILAVLQHGEHGIDLLQVARRLVLVGAHAGAEPQVLLDGQAAEHLAALRHHGKAQARDVFRRLAGNLLAGELDEALARGDDTRDGLQQRGLASAIGAGHEQRLALARR